MSWPNKVERLAEAVFKRDVRKNLAITFSGFFYGALKIRLEGSWQDKTYTAMEKPGVAMIHLSYQMALKAAGYQLGQIVAGESADKAATLIKRAFLAFGYHEIGHLKLTDMSGDRFEELSKTVSVAQLRFIQQVSNILEDPTQERMLGKIAYYAFVRKYFKWIVEKMFLPEAKRFVDKGDLASFMNYLLLYVRLGKRRIAGGNAWFDRLAKKGITKRIRAASLEPDGVKRCRMQVEIALWIIKELNLDDKRLGATPQLTPTRPVIILIDPTTKKPMKQAPMNGPLPPVSIVEAPQGDDGSGGGEAPDADIIDMRKNKGKSEKAPEDASGQKPAQSPEGENRKEDGKDEGKEASGSGTDGPKPSKPKEGTGSEGSEGSDEGEEGKGSEEGKEGAKSEKGGSADEGEGDGDEADSGSDPGPQNGDGAGRGAGSMPAGSSDEGDFEFGDEDPLMVLDDDFNDSFDEYDPDLEAAKGMSSASPVYADDAFRVVDDFTIKFRHDKISNSYAEEILDLSQSIADMKAESAPKTYHRLEEGDELDIDSVIESEQSPYPSMDVFQEERKGKPVTDLAVSLLVDCSGSMAGVRSDCAFATATMIVSACEDNGVSTEITAFSDKDVLYVKRFDEDASTAVERLGLLDSGQRNCYSELESCGLWGGTNLPSALRVVLGKLSARELNAFKILFVITDGDTGGRDVVRKLLAKAEEDRIIVVAIGINLNVKALGECFGECAAFTNNSLRQLPTYVSNVLKDALSSKERWLND